MAVPVRIFFYVNEILIDTIPAPFVAGSLIATQNGDSIDISRAESAYLFTSILWNRVADINGSTFASMADTLAYLTTQFTMRRSVDIPSASAVASVAIAAGLPVCISRATGQMQIARADTYTLSFLAGLASATVAQGFVGAATRNALTLPDWTLVAGTASLALAQPYFLGPQGGITLSAPAAPINRCSVRVGQATSPQTFAFAQSDPVTL